MLDKNELLYTKPDHRIIAMGEYKRIRWAILNNNGMFPLAYVQTSIDLYEDEKANELVNGGITFFETCYWNEEDKRLYAGWDYGHCWNYNTYYEKDYPQLNKDNPKTTYNQIMEEIKNLIDYILEKEEEK